MTFITVRKDTLSAVTQRCSVTVAQSRWQTVPHHCTLWVKKVAPTKTFCNIFTQVKYISMKFCQYVASLYLHMCTSFGRFILIFNKIALIFVGVAIVFNVFRFKFHHVKSPQQFANNRVVSNSSDFNPLDYQAWGKCWSLEKDSWLQAYVSSNGENFEHVMWQFV